MITWKLPPGLFPIKQRGCCRERTDVFAVKVWQSFSPEHAQGCRTNAALGLVPKNSKRFTLHAAGSTNTCDATSLVIWKLHRKHLKSRRIHPDEPFIEAREKAISWTLKGMAILTSSPCFNVANHTVRNHLTTYTAQSPQAKSHHLRSRYSYWLASLHTTIPSSSIPQSCLSPRKAPQTIDWRINDSTYIDSKSRDRRHPHHLLVWLRGLISLDTLLVLGTKYGWRAVVVGMVRRCWVLLVASQSRQLERGYAQRGDGEDAVSLDSIYICENEGGADTYTLKYPWWAFFVTGVCGIPYNAKCPWLRTLHSRFHYQLRWLDKYSSLKSTLAYLNILS